MDVRTLIAIAFVVFGAGVSYGGYKRLLRDVNGLGKKQGRFERSTVTALMNMAKDDDQRRWLAQHFRD